MIAISHPAKVAQSQRIESAHGQQIAFGRKINRCYWEIVRIADKQHRSLTGPDFIATILAARCQILVISRRPAQAKHQPVVGSPLYYGQFVFILFEVRYSNNSATYLGQLALCRQRLDR